MLHVYSAWQIGALHVCYWVLVLSSASTLVGVLTMFSQARKHEEIYRFEIVATGIAGGSALLSLIVLIQIFAGMML